MFNVLLLLSYYYASFQPENYVISILLYPLSTLSLRLWYPKMLNTKLLVSTINTYIDTRIYKYYIHPRIILYYQYIHNIGCVSSV